MTFHHRRLATRLGAVASSVPLALAFTPSAHAAGEASTPGTTVVVVNPGTRPDASDLAFALTAHTERTATVDNPSCRPQDQTLDCWGSLTLRVPAMGGMRISGLEVHRVAVGDITCGDEGDDGGCSGDDGGCSGDDGGCTGGDTAAPSAAAGPAAGEAVHAQVNGLAVITDPGSSTYPAGTRVQVKFTLTDNTTGLYGDQAEVVINKFVPGPVKPLIYDSGVQTIQQVQIHEVGHS